MAVQNKDLPRFAIVSHKPYLKRALLAAAVLWLVLAAAWVWLFWRGQHTDAGRLRTELGAARGQLADARGDIAELKQRLTNAERAEFISRSANNQVQDSLAEKEEQIAGLKADLDFYERLVGAGGRRHGLSVHNAEFEATAAGAWRYTVTLTQNINRGGITSGLMRFSIEGVQAGKLKRLDWGALVNSPGSTGQKFAFRYFQQLEGAILLPAGFTPQRVKVSVNGSAGAREQAFDWNPVKPPAALPAQ